MTAYPSMEIKYVAEDGTVTYDGLALLQELAAATSGGAVADGDYGDVVVSGGGTVWTVDAVVIALDDLSDVVLTAPATNDVLTFDGAGWVNAPAASGGGSPIMAWLI